jgi:ABC-type nitrate/sulfonate/bicarbonate transport system ATPase subunit
MVAVYGTDRGIVFQQYSVFPHMTVLENVMAARAFQRRGISGYLFGKAKRTAKTEATHLLEQVGLRHALVQYPHQLSGGMKQRLAIAQALLGKPRVLLLDEPFCALDPGNRAEMHQLVRQLWREHCSTIFMVTHDLKEGFYLGKDSGCSTSCAMIPRPPPLTGPVSPTTCRSDVRIAKLISPSMTTCVRRQHQSRHNH